MQCLDFDTYGVHSINFNCQWDLSFCIFRFEIISVIRIAKPEETFVREAMRKLHASESRVMLLYSSKWAQIQNFECWSLKGPRSRIERPDKNLSNFNFSPKWIGMMSTIELNTTIFFPMFELSWTRISDSTCFLFKLSFSTEKEKRKISDGETSDNFGLWRKLLWFELLCLLAFCCLVSLDCCVFQERGWDHFWHRARGTRDREGSRVDREPEHCRGSAAGEDSALWVPHWPHGWVPTSGLWPTWSRATHAQVAERWQWTRTAAQKKIRKCVHFESLADTVRTISPQKSRELGHLQDTRKNSQSNLCILPHSPPPKKNYPQSLASFFLG